MSKLARKMAGPRTRCLTRSRSARSLEWCGAVRDYRIVVWVSNYLGRSGRSHLGFLCVRVLVHLFFRSITSCSGIV